MAQKTMFSCTAHFKSSLNIILTKMPQRWKGSNTSKSDRITALQYTIEHVLIFLLKFEVCAIREVRTDHSIRPQSLSSKAKRLFARVDCSMSYSVCASVLLFVGVGASYLWKCIVICESVSISRIVFDLCKCFVTRASIFHPSKYFPTQQVFSIRASVLRFVEVYCPCEPPYKTVHLTSTEVLSRVSYNNANDNDNDNDNDDNNRTDGRLKCQAILGYQFIDYDHCFIEQTFVFTTLGAR